MMIKRSMVAMLALLAIAATARAADITAQATLKITKGYIDIQRSVNMTNAIASSPPAMAGLTQTIGTNAAELVTVGDVTTKGWSWFRNLSSDGNVIAIGTVDASTNFWEVLRLAIGEFAMGPLGTNDLYAISIGTNAATSELEKIIVSD